MNPAAAAMRTSETNRTAGSETHHPDSLGLVGVGLLLRLNRLQGAVGHLGSLGWGGCLRHAGIVSGVPRRCAVFCRLRVRHPGVVGERRVVRRDWYVVSRGMVGKASSAFDRSAGAG